MINYSVKPYPLDIGISPFREANRCCSLEGQVIGEDVVKAISPLLSDSDSKNVVNIHEFHIHYHGEEKKEEKQLSGKGSNDTIKKVIQRLKEATPFLCQSSTIPIEKDQQTECANDLPPVHEEPSVDRKKKRDEVIQKIAFFVFGFLLGSVTSVCMVVGSKALIQGALAVSAIVGIVKCSSSIIREIGSIIATARETLTIFLDEL